MKIITAIILATLMIMGCSAIQLSPNVEMVAIKSAARVAGYQFAVKNSSLVPATLSYAKTFNELANGTFTDSDKLINELWPAAVKSLLGHVSDPVVKSILSDVVAMVQINVPNISVGTKSTQIKFAIQGFIEGIEMVGKR